jgi:leader peptidase (prepilin peptidase) / N-methyltransferase
LLLLSEYPAWFVRTFAIVMGLLWGSFLNVVIYRVPLGLSVVRPGSHCPGCGTPIKAYDNIPVFSYLILRGKARCCGVSFSPRYPLIEAAGGLLAWAIVEGIILRLPPETSIARGIAIFSADLTLVLGLLAASMIDLEHMYIPSGITLGGTLLGIATATFRPPLTWKETALGAGIGFLMVFIPFDFLYRKIRGRTGMAMGDAMLVMMAGAWFGWQGALFALMAGAVQGTVAAIVILLVKGKIEDPEAVQKERDEILKELAALPEKERAELEKELLEDPIFQESEGGMGARIAFGPFLALAMMEYLFVGQSLVEQIFWVQG